MRGCKPRLNRHLASCIGWDHPSAGNRCKYLSGLFSSGRQPPIICGDPGLSLDVYSIHGGDLRQGRVSARKCPRPSINRGNGKAPQTIGRNCPRFLKPTAVPYLTGYFAFTRTPRYASPALFLIGIRAHSRQCRRFLLLTHRFLPALHPSSACCPPTRTATQPPYHPSPANLGLMFPEIQFTVISIKCHASYYCFISWDGNRSHARRRFEGPRSRWTMELPIVPRFLRPE
jgi:hypothetical protein